MEDSQPAIDPLLAEFGLINKIYIKSLIKLLARYDKTFINLITWNVAEHIGFTIHNHLDKALNMFTVVNVHDFNASLTGEMLIWLHDVLNVKLLS